MSKTNDLFIELQELEKHNAQLEQEIADLRNTVRQLCEIRFYVVRVWEDVEPSLYGPYATDLERDAAAIALRRQDEQMEDGLYWLDVTAKKCGTGSYAYYWLDSGDTKNFINLYHCDCGEEWTERAIKKDYITTCRKCGDNVHPQESVDITTIPIKEE